MTAPRFIAHPGLLDAFESVYAIDTASCEPVVWRMGHSLFLGTLRVRFHTLAPVEAGCAPEPSTRHAHTYALECAAILVEAQQIEALYEHHQAREANPWNH